MLFLLLITKVSVGKMHVSQNNSNGAGGKTNSFVGVQGEELSGRLLPSLLLPRHLLHFL